MIPSWRSIRHRFVLVALLCGLAPPSLAAHAIARFGEPKYPETFRHFDYINPDAPKGGHLNLSVTSQNSSFDTFNPFALRGRPAPGLLELLFETLTVNSLDEVNTQYGLLAEDLDLAADERSITFRLHADARFSNGDPVTAADVKHSFDTLTGKQASPQFRSYFSEIADVVVVDERHVRFDFTRPGRDLSFVAGSLPVFSPKWGLRADGSRASFDELALELPISSGPYVLRSSNNSLNVSYHRNPEYWARDLPVRRGAFNFDTVTYKLYKDKNAVVAAMRAGEYDFFSETQMRYWCCQFIGKRFDSGEIIKEKIPNRSLAPMNGYAFNLRREKFQDIRVRQALNLLYDWQWLNKNIFDNEFARQESHFANSDLAARGLPGPDELALLEPFRHQLDPAVFGPMVELPSTLPPSSPRQNMRRALALFAEAGWHFRDGALRNDKGEPFVLETTGSGGVLLDAYYVTLGKVGIQVRFGVADAVADRARLRNFDFDFRMVALRKNRDPVPELWRNFNGADADVPGSENLVGLKSPVVDALLKALGDARTEAQLRAAARALDRVLMHGAYLIPWRYLPDHYLMYSKRLQRPTQLPLYFGPYEWVLGAWWDGDTAAIH